MVGRSANVEVLGKAEHSEAQVNLLHRRFVRTDLVGWLDKSEKGIDHVGEGEVVPVQRALAKGRLSSKKNHEIPVDLKVVGINARYFRQRKVTVCRFILHNHESESAI